MNTVKKICLGIILLLTSVIGYSQDISIQVLVPTAPPPASLAEIISFESEVIIILNNTSTRVREIKLIASLTDITRGHNLTMKRGIPGLTPITLSPGQVREIRFRELRALYGDVTANDFIIDGFNYEQIIREERLPEGTYSLCIEALDFFTDEQLSMDGSCGFFPIIAYDPPIIIFPGQGASLTATNPQNIIFTWTPTGLPQTTKYRFQLVNTEDYQFANPFDVFNYQGEVFTYQQNDLQTTFFHYDISKPPLQEGATYALRVQAYDNDNELNYINGGWSEPVAFTYLPSGNGIDPVGTNFEVEPTSPNLVANDCLTYDEAINTSFNTGVSVGQSIAVGPFTMELNQLSLNAAQQTYSGSGSIYIDFLQQAIDVQFESIRINNNLRMYGDQSLVYATNENTSIVPENVSSIYDTPQDLNFPPGFQSYLNNHESPSTQMGVPFRISGTQAVVAGIIFTPGFSKAKLAIPIPYPQTSANSDPYIPYYNNNVCITPGGYVEDVLTFTLNEDLTLPFQNNLVELVLPQDGNRIIFNTDGSMSFDLDAQLSFDRSIVRYQSSLHEVSFIVEETGIPSLNGLFSADLALNERVVYPALNDLSLDITQALLDFSDQANHSQFNNKYPGQTSLWQGIYCPELNVHLPSGLGGENVNFNIGGLALSGNGLSLQFNRQSTVVGIGTGRLAQWPFSITGFQLDIEEGQLNNGSFDGRLRLPIQQSGGIDYTATLSSIDNQLGINLTASAASDFNVPMWKAGFQIFEGSSIGLDRIGGAYRLLAHLNGRITIDFENPAATGTLSQLNIPALTFEDFTIEGRDLPGFVPQLDFAFIELENPSAPQLSFEYFDFTLRDVSVRRTAAQPNRYGLELDLGLSLFGGGILSGSFGAGANTKLTVWAKYQNGFSYDRIQLDEITGDMDLGIAEASVAINLFNRDATFGNGFKGDADIALKTSGASFGAGFSIQFGKVNDYRYWYFDGYYKQNPGIILGPSGVSIYGFGGGGYYNMQVNQSAEGSPISYNELSGSSTADPTDPTSTHSGFQFTPQKNNAGFLANSIIGSSASPSAWNVQSKFLMDFNRHPNFAINSVHFAGKLRMMKVLSDDSAPDFNLVASSETAFQLLIQRENQSRTIHASLHHELSGLFSSVSIPVDFHSTYNITQGSRQWYLHVGRWSQADPFSDDSRIAITRGIDTPVFKAGVDIRAYLMLGNHFPPPTYAGLPPLPDYITNQTDDAGNAGVSRNGSDAETILNAMDSPFSSTFGIGTGLGVRAGFTLDNVPIFYADMSAEVVVDGLLSKTLGCADGSRLGFNNWYLQGQAYAYVHGEVGARVRFLGRTLRKSLVNIHAGAILQAELPNPSWLKGGVFIGGELLGGRIRFRSRRVNFEFGDRCEQIQDGYEHPFAEFDYIGEFIPGDGTENVSVFVDPRVSFNLNDNEEFEVTEVGGETHTYRVTFDYFLKESGSTRGVSMQEIHWNDARSALRLTPKDWLEEQTWYEFSILIRGYEYKNGNWGNPIYEETETSSFKTGDRPDQFILEDIISSYPGFRQRYFMTNNDDGGRAEGWLQMDKTVCGDILDANQASNFEEGNIIRFTNIRTRTFTETPCWCKNDKTLAFDFPADRLSREEIYRINIGFREKEGYFTANTADLDEVESTYAGSNTLTLDANDPGQYEQLQNEYTDKSQFVNKFKYINLLDPAAQWYAQTSRFQSYQEKLSSFSVDGTIYLPRMISYSYSYEVDLPFLPILQQSAALGKTFQIPVILLDPGGIAEPFDHFDIVGYRHPLAIGGRVDPILNPFHGVSYLHSSKMVDLRADQYFEDLQNETLKDIIDDLTAGSPIHRPNRYPFFYEPVRYGPLKRWMQNYNQLEGELQNAGHNVTIQRPAHPLRDSEINRFIDGASDQTSSGSLGLLPDPTHGSGAGTSTTYGVYTPYSPPTGSNSFQTVDAPSDVDFDPGFDVQSNFTSYYALIDWTPRTLNQDRKRANLHAVSQVAAAAGQVHNLSLYFQALDLLDQKFESTQLPLGNYQIKLVNELDKTYRILPYQVNQQ